LNAYEGQRDLPWSVFLIGSASGSLQGGLFMRSEC